MNINSPTADDSWLITIDEIKRTGQAVEPQQSTGAKGRVSFEIMNHSIAYNMQYPIVTVKPNTSWIYMAAEAMWVLEGSNRLNWSPEVARIQAPYSDDGKILAGAYGPHFKHQQQYVRDTLNKDRNTRQAVMTLWRRNPLPAKDISCTVSMQFFIRNDTIFTVVNMRSSDAGMGLPYDMLTFACLTAEIASGLEHPVELGYCFLNAGSRHIYEDQWDKLDLETMAFQRYRYEPWQLWKWPAIKQIMLDIAKMSSPDSTNRQLVQDIAKKALMEASGENRTRSNDDSNSPMLSS